jgi:heme-degrading monooxygenase HmoA
MIERHWTAMVKADQSDRYINHLMHDTFVKLKNIDGFVRASVLTRNQLDGVVFRVVTVWSSHEAIKRFAGDDISSAVVPDIVLEMMIHFDRKVEHYDVAATI